MHIIGTILHKNSYEILQIIFKLLSSIIRWSYTILWNYQIYIVDSFIDINILKYYNTGK